MSSDMYRNNGSLEKTCANCGSAYTTSREHQRYCCTTCRKESNNRKYRERAGIDPLKATPPPAVTGAIHELLVSVELMRMGFHVFRALASACPCDLVCMTTAKTYRIEVTTSNFVTGFYGRENFVKKSDKYLYDFLAVVSHDGGISWYDRENNKCDAPDP